MSDGPLQVKVLSTSEVDASDHDPLVLRSSALIESLPKRIREPVASLDALLNDGELINQNWRDQIVEYLRSQSDGSRVRYVVSGDPLHGDVTVQHLLAMHGAGDILVRIERSTNTDSFARSLAGFPAPQVFVDALTLREIDAGSPFAGGSFPLSPNQTTIITNAGTSEGSHLRRVLERCYGPDAVIHRATADGATAGSAVTPAELVEDKGTRWENLVIPAATGDHFYRTPDDLRRLVARLRAPGGCPWDREQTNESLTRNLIEESYELLEAIESGVVDDMREEMGDFLLQAYLHCQITEEEGRFTLEDVLDTLITKLVRRHPHVFATATADDAEHVVRNWDEIKRAERAEKENSHNGGPLGNVPVSMPALSRAQTLLKRARRTGVEPEEVVRQRNDTVARAAATASDADILNDLLTTIERAAESGIDLEEHLRAWSRAFEHSFSSPVNQADEPDRP